MNFDDMAEVTGGLTQEVCLSCSSDQAEHPVEATVQDSVLMIAKAVDFAAQVHAGQRRKGEAAEPYFNHLAQVAHILASNGADSGLIAAGYLHDAIEDQGVSAEQIRLEFGHDVVDLVPQVTDDKTLPKSRRKELQIEHAPHMGRRAQMLKIADKISNLTGILESPPADWSVERRIEYANWAARVVDACRPGHPRMAKQFDVLRARLVASQATGSAS
jgi:(p)ppGpp synthase/HD superfamily hydrolase